MDVRAVDRQDDPICYSKGEIRKCISEDHEYLCMERMSDLDTIGAIQCNEVTGSTALEEGVVLGGGGSDSGVEGCGGRAFSSAGRSCASSASVVSCGSESSSLAAGSDGIEPGQRKKKVAVTEPPATRRQAVGRGVAPRGPNLATRERARSREKPAAEKPRPLAPKPAVPPRIRPRTAAASSVSSSALPALQRESPAYKAKPTKTSTARCRTPGTPPDDAKWPAFPNRSPLHSVMTLSRTSDSSSLKSKMTDSRTFDKYATLPRRRREASPDGRTTSDRDNARERALSTSRKSAIRDRDSPIMRTLPPYPRNKTQKIRIYHETSVQTALIGHDVECALAGIGIKDIRTDLVLVEKSNKGVQADGRSIEIEKLEAKVRHLTDVNAKLQQLCDVQKQKLADSEVRLEEERTEKVSAQEELQRNTQRVLAMLGQEPPTAENGSDSLMVLEFQLQTSANIVVKQQEEINKLHKICRTLKQDLDRTTNEQHRLEQQLLDAECEHTDLQEFLATEKATLQDAMKDLEEENALKSTELAKLCAECRHLVRISEQRRQETLALQARLKRLQGAMYGGGSMNVAEGAIPVLEGLIRRLQSLLDTLVISYKISKEDLEEVVYHNEAYSCTASSGDNSPEATNETKTPCDVKPPVVKTSGGSSLLSAFMSAIRSATGVITSQNTNDTRDEDPKLSDDENSAELLDSETEPCIMMENVLEDVTMPDTYSQNLVSSGLSLMTSSISQVLPISPSSGLAGESRSRFIPTLGINRQLGYYNKDDSCNSLHNFANFSCDDLSPVNRENTTISDAEGREDTYEYSEQESLQNLSQAIINRQQSEAECSLSEDLLSKDNEEVCCKEYVVDKVILVDNLITKLLKVLRIIQLENEASAQQMNSIKENLSIMDKNVAEAVSTKLVELEKCKARVLQYQATIEDLNKKMEQAQTTEPSMAKCNQEISALRGKLALNGRLPTHQQDTWTLQKHLRTQYEAIDKALQVFHSVQPLVSDCPQLANLQSELETLCFQTACEVVAPPPLKQKPTSPLPGISDCNANGPQAINSAA